MDMRRILFTANLKESSPYTDDLPNGFVRLDWIDTELGKQYELHTDHIVTNNTEIRVVFTRLSETVHQYDNVFTNKSNHLFGLYLAPKYTFQSHLGRKYKTPYNFYLNSKYDYIHNNKHVIVNGVKVLDWDPIEPFTGGEIIFFKDQFQRRDSANIRLFEIEIKEKGVKVSHLIPCLHHTTGDVGMYDMIKKRFHRSSNEIAFIASPNLTPKKYITFEDPEVARICIQNFSSNGIYLTEEDANKVTELGTIFKDNTNIKRFTELEQFKNLTHICNDAFGNCSNLECIRFPKSLKTVGDRSFENTSKLTDIGNLLTSPIIYSIGVACFRNSSITGIINLPGLNINNPTGNAGIGQLAFRGTNITEVRNLGGCKMIWHGLFQECPNLTKAILPETSNRFGDIFTNSRNFTTLIVKAVVPPSASTNIFKNCPLTDGIYVPDASVDAYKTAPDWLNYANKIKPLSTYKEV